GPTPLRRQYVVEAWAFSPGADSTRCEVVVTIPALDVLDFRVVLQRSGPLEFCEGESVTLDPGTGYDRYEWSNGDSTRLLTVRASGTYSCVLFLGGRRGYSDTLQVNVVPRPRPRLVTEGSLPLCPGDTLWIDAGADYAAYSWSNGLAVRRFPATRIGTYSVDVTDAFGCSGRSDSVTVTMFPAASIPVIVRSGDVLETAEAAAWQWRRYGSDIPGATARAHTLIETGIYTVRITDANGCVAISDPFIVNLLGVENAAPLVFELQPHPNPGSGRFTLRLPAGERADMLVTDMLGRTLLRETRDPAADGFHVLDLAGHPAGVYLLSVRLGGHTAHHTLLIR
ncbi:MAG: T9SS type A sorting domain-containing protein, partial [Bacteroidetes bacterium]|nr:T9SS type A sorting domain-containing protein [Bacteroidota bacterium]